MGVDALLALQEVGSPLEGKRRAVRRASRILDILDEVKLALLDGGTSVAQLDRLRRAVKEERGLTSDPKLDEVLDQIELRAAVEIAKLEIAALCGLNARIGSVPIEQNNVFDVHAARIFRRPGGVRIS